ncbi:YybH family protein [Roseateles violae]|uniref:Nuclear transport factor 2 family protein n=1 Tax=Roseateles violae TaxID=3058042 RepID=A0ABT8DN89_9BURK|nr:nuclear transport factor 2 family protein [Pelomonas sp. PFR6]MDN3919413.1 nuclear transport factor 2 family protein [Pelomonas sp. PFR6]
MHRPKAQTAALLASPEDTEQQFYEALQHADMQRLIEVWADEEDICCVHPGGPRLIGLAAIRASFETLFAQGALNVHPERVRKLRSGDSAIHQVLERVQVGGADGRQQAWVVVTNVYLKTAQGWRLVVHHASPGSAQDLPDVADEPATLH